ncbi:MAG: hypothetical protein Kow00108_04430 [Calditrichia bacterium]
MVNIHFSIGGELLNHKRRSRIGMVAIINGTVMIGVGKILINKDSR